MKRKAIEGLVSEWTDILGIKEWVVHTRLYRRLGQDQQSIDWRYSEKIAKMSLRESDSAERQEHAIAHELSHLIHSAENRVFDNLVDTIIIKRERERWTEQFNLAQNESIEAYLRVIYRLLDKIYPPHEG